jgi:hypothetical protein
MSRKMLSPYAVKFDPQRENITLRGGIGSPSHGFRCVRRYGSKFGPNFQRHGSML